jgi:hypothetical protein
MGFWYRAGQRWGVILPWWLIAVLALLWVVGFAVAFVLWLLWQPVRLVDHLAGHRLSAAFVAVAGSPGAADFSQARQQSVDRWGKREV